MTNIEALTEKIKEVEGILAGIEKEMAELPTPDPGIQLEYRSFSRHRDELRQQLAKAEKEPVVA